MNSLAKVASFASGFARRRFDGFVTHHQNGTRMFWYMGVLSLVAYPSLYFVRYIRAGPSYDDWWLRAISFLLGFLLLQIGWPERLKRYYMPFAYGALIFMLPFSLMFVALKNQGGSAAVANAMTGLFLVILLTDWRNTICVILIGLSLGILAYLAVEPIPVWPKDFVERGPLVFVAGVAASLIKAALIETTGERITKLEREQREGRVAALQETIGFLAHELNTPLAEVRLLAGSMREMCSQGSLDASQANDAQLMLERVEKRAHYSQELVKRLMRSAYHVRYDGGPQALTASSLVQSLLENYPFPDDMGPDIVDVQREVDFILPGSRELLYLVLSTLTHNSLMALRGNPSPRLQIEIVGHSTGARGGMIRVTDNGCGVPLEVLSKLTKGAVPSSWKNGQGGGMGLVFAQRVMDANGGAVTVESVAGKGTTVTLSFAR
ncbi:hypothetical protein GHT07_19050 [Caenimonas koreensis DSM 17982]|uniref:histidine kinase n=1 Tax=Caenimonas koreensis DSM 17982 TaxID=1121255 RepID=A0A844BCI7_9BURK|nr:HAMP domain-containing sensor histidine kinase [Caenimonas koreensis]MRD49379.1 hypothetical protein [Caenimonas koreensis DSM 17982]